ncbi:Transglutaminase elicitor [Phytophthora infestans]|uniref:Transglutaminase elicitor n=1 Tax=Phytophthora infestans TaxID=4787 RepID=A0A8S9UM28_PHYIN|nr:Transglutaminase elicitor [Phytophthora infestans]
MLNTFCDFMQDELYMLMATTRSQAKTSKRSRFADDLVDQQGDSHDESQTQNPLDIKGLISDVYDGAKAPRLCFTGARYNGGDDGTDEYGRHTNDAYRDLESAYFHIAAANGS